MTASIVSSRVLVDPNLVVYSYDLADPSKHLIAQDSLERISNAR
jgi:hypothetical protein